MALFGYKDAKVHEAIRLETQYNAASLFSREVGKGGLGVAQSLSQDTSEGSHTPNGAGMVAFLRHTSHPSSVLCKPPCHLPLLHFSLLLSRLQRPLLPWLLPVIAWKKL
jgi:hypothetical protein